uniref:Uncharacterized protein n=1 Tax=Mycena chlorophos TaxID=658473 RepID=A0ABQ0LZL5_MYCCL|nr:predicted protein [Mycena chlorophos]
MYHSRSRSGARGKQPQAYDDDFEDYGSDEDQGDSDGFTDYGHDSRVPARRDQRHSQIAALGRGLPPSRREDFDHYARDTPRPAPSRSRSLTIQPSRTEINEYFNTDDRATRRPLCRAPSSARAGDDDRLGALEEENALLLQQIALLQQKTSLMTVTGATEPPPAANDSRHRSRSSSRAPGRTQVRSRARVAADSNQPESLPLISPPLTLRPFNANEKKKLQAATTTAFRRLTDLLGKDWPQEYSRTRRDPDTNEEILSPLFGMGSQITVAHPENVVILQKLATQIHQELLDSRPLAVAHEATWTAADVLAWTKQSYSSVKKDWVAVFKPGKQARVDDLKTQDRRKMRKNRKVNDLKDAVAKYATESGLDADVLDAVVDAEFVSDEYSGPDDASESKPDWMVRMAQLSGITDLSAENLANRRFLECATNAWQSDELIQIYHGLHATHDQKRTGTSSSGAVPYTRVRNTGRTSTRVPRLTPMDWMINVSWLEEHRAAGDELLEDWGKMGSPAGFGVATAVGAETSAEAGGVDVGVDAEGE